MFCAGSRPAASAARAGLAGPWSRGRFPPRVANRGPMAQQQRAGPRSSAGPLLLRLWQDTPSAALVSAPWRPRQRANGPGCRQNWNSCPCVHGQPLWAPTAASHPARSHARLGPSPTSIPARLPLPLRTHCPVPSPTSVSHQRPVRCRASSPRLAARPRRLRPLRPCRVSGPATGSALHRADRRMSGPTTGRPGRPVWRGTGCGGAADAGGEGAGEAPGVGRHHRAGRHLQLLIGRHTAVKSEQRRQEGEGGAEATRGGRAEQRRQGAGGRSRGGAQSTAFQCGPNPLRAVDSRPCGCRERVRSPARAPVR